MMGELIPQGFDTLQQNDRVAVVRSDVKEDVAAALRAGTLYDFARNQPDKQTFRGRGEAFAFRLEHAGISAVVRHSRHGGTFAFLTQDLFRWPGRAPEELQIAMRLRERGVRTPEFLAYVLYPVAPGLCRADIMTRFVEGARDLATLLRDSSDHYTRASALRATAVLLGALEAARAHHPDLNLRNVLVSSGAEGDVAWIIDVDRVQLDELSFADTGVANVRRLLRSARKLREKEGLAVRDEELVQLSSRAPTPR